MDDKRLDQGTHPLGERDKESEGYPAPHRVDTIGGPVHVRWEESPGISTQGILTYFIQFLQQSGLWQSLVDECPLRRTSPNAPTNQEILGTIVLSILSGHRRYAHITAIRGDDVLPELLGIARLRSEDSIRRAFAQQDETALTTWIDLQMDRKFTTRPPLCSIRIGSSIWTRPSRPSMATKSPPVSDTTP